MTQKRRTRTRPTATFTTTMTGTMESHTRGRSRFAKHESRAPGSDEELSYHGREQEELHVDRMAYGRVEHLPGDISTFYTAAPNPPRRVARVAIRWHWQN